MTVYVVTDRPDHILASLWADSDDEAWEMAVACGAELVPADNERFVLFLITPDQRLLARQLGAQPVDWLGPAYWHAVLGGELDRLDAFDAYRNAWHRMANDQRRHPSL